MKFHVVGSTIRYFSISASEKLAGEDIYVNMSREQTGEENIYVNMSRMEVTYVVEGRKNLTSSEAVGDTAYSPLDTMEMEGINILRARGSRERMPMTTFLAVKYEANKGRGVTEDRVTVLEDEEDYDIPRSRKMVSPETMRARGLIPAGQPQLGLDTDSPSINMKMEG